MRPEVIVANNGEECLKNNECGGYNDLAKMPLPMKDEIIDECGNMVIDEYGDICFESKIEIVENILDEPELSELVDNTDIKLSEKQTDDDNAHILIKGCFESQNLISNHLETIHVECKRTIQPPLEVVNENSDAKGIEAKIYAHPLATSEHFVDTNLSADREENLSDFSDSELNNDNIDIGDNVSKSPNDKPYAKDKTKESNYQNTNEGNKEVVQFEGEVQRLPVGYCVGMDLILNVIMEKNDLCEEKVYQKMLDTREKLFISLRRDDLYKLQKQQNEDHSDTEENGTVKWRRWRSNQPTKFWCKLCPFTANDKCSLMIHIVENHKELAAKKKLPSPECMTPGEDPNIIWYKCLECAYVSKSVHTYDLHSSRHNPQSRQTLSCAQCSFKTKWRGHLIKHFNVHREIYHKCTYCDFKTKGTSYLNKHIRMIHKADEVEILKCKKCSFQSKYKECLKKHSIIHSNAKMYKCDLCPFQTRWLEVLKYSHSIKHKSEEEARIHKCEFCPYKAKMKQSLRKHMLIHKSIDELKMYKCGICSFQTRHKCYINTHRLTHQAPDEDNMHPCDLCSYQGKTRQLMLIHRRNHKKPEECKMYKCEKCPYQSRSSNNLKRHSLQHKSKDELSLFECDKCGYRGNSKDRIMTHYNNVHRRPEEIKWQKCNVCDFQTKHLGNLKRHLLIHMDPREANKFKCDHCSFRAKTKREVKSHAVKHSNVYLKCDQCSFQTKYYSTLSMHRKRSHS